MGEVPPKDQNVGYSEWIILIASLKENDPKNHGLVLGYRHPWRYHHNASMLERGFFFQPALEGLSPAWVGE
jgi:hypothetical protein